MPDEPIDGFSDVKQQGQNSQDPHDSIPGPPDPGASNKAAKPFSPEEEARLKQEMEEDQEEDSERLQQKQ